ncbi:MAG: phosphatidylserine/phosphatidylglycerophosphate/cardiolipin synthase family protein [Methylobacteriaceae bacterium]|nr:phosphatidylserine/phosphatidylglycerophosphate/cardiolipin synthase family protein [Methylobacteriaceae bacterium]
MGDLTTQTFADGAISATLFEQRGHPSVPDAARDDQIGHVANLIGAFIEGAKTSLDIAVYDFRLDGAPGERIVSAIASRAQAGIAIRIIRDPTTSGGDDSPGGDSSIATTGAVGKPASGIAFLQRLAASAAIKPVSGFKTLMHNKYIIRDALSPEASVLMGSANFTNDAWGLQEANIVVLHSQDLSAYYATDFQQLWSRGKITPSTGYRDTGVVRIGDTNVTVAFTPGESATIVHNVVNAIEIATERLTIATMVMSSGPILAAICEAIDRGVVLSGLYDGPQMDTVLNQWAAAGIAADKAALWHKVVAYLARKNSIPYDPAQPHNFMHAKLIVADDIVITGSFNFSNHARGNAENTLLVACPAMADAYGSWIKSLATRYRASPTG